MGINLNLFAYPNPTSDLLILEVENPKGQSFSYHLYDMQGKLKRNEKVTGNSTTIKMGDQSIGIYFLRVTNKNKVVKTFRIIKN